MFSLTRSPNQACASSCGATEEDSSVSAGLGSSGSKSINPSPYVIRPLRGKIENLYNVTELFLEGDWKPLQCTY